MARFDQPQDPLFARINASIGFDLRLWPQDIEGSRAHVGALHRAGIVDDGERDGAARRPRRGRRASSSAGEFELRDGDEDIHMAIERRLTEIVGPGRRQAPHRALAKRPGGHRPGAVRPRARASAAASWSRR